MTWILLFIGIVLFIILDKDDDLYGIVEDIICVVCIVGMLGGTITGIVTAFNKTTVVSSEVISCTINNVIYLDNDFYVLLATDDVSLNKVRNDNLMTLTDNIYIIKKIDSDVAFLYNSNVGKEVKVKLANCRTSDYCKVCTFVDTTWQDISIGG